MHDLQVGGPDVHWMEAELPLPTIIDQIQRYAALNESEYHAKWGVEEGLAGQEPSDQDSEGQATALSSLRHSDLDSLFYGFKNWPPTCEKTDDQLVGLFN